MASIKLSELSEQARAQVNAVAGTKPRRKRTRPPAVQHTGWWVEHGGKQVRVDSAGEQAMYVWLERLGITVAAVHPLIKLSPRMRHEFDFLLPSRLLVEVQGGAGTPHMGHTSVKGMRQDYEWWAHALALGYHVLPVTTQQALDGSGALLALRVLEAWCVVPRLT